MKKKISAHIAIILILVGGFLNVYIKASSLSCGRNQLSAFAADDTYSWESVSKDDLVTAFKYYCKSRNLAIEGSVADAVTNFTTTTFNNLCNTLGIDSTSLQAELKKTTGGNLGLRFLFTQTGVNAYNRIFAEFLQNNDLDEGDSVDDLNVYSGESYSYNGHSCLVYVLDINIGSGQDYNYTRYNHIVSHGTAYQYSLADLISIGSDSSVSDSRITVDFPSPVSMTIYHITNDTSSKGLIGLTSYNCPIHNNGTNEYITSSTNLYGYPSIVKFADGSYYSCYFTNVYTSSISGGNFTRYRIHTYSYISNPDIETANVYITTNNNTINNNTYNTNYTIIYNDGDYYDYDDDDEPDPSTPPGGGGGGGGDDPDPDEPPIVDPTPTPEPSIPDWDIELPEMPVGNEWLLYGLEKKFPWDIPFNLMYILSLFAADPETPHFQGTLDLKVVQWDYDIDLAPFDDIARNVRNFEFVGFIIGLMLLTRRLIWG